MFKIMHENLRNNFQNLIGRDKTAISYLLRHVSFLNERLLKSNYALEILCRTLIFSTIELEYAKLLARCIFHFIPYIKKDWQAGKATRSV